MNPDSVRQRITARGKFLFAGDTKFYLQGITYGPFQPESPESPYFKNPDITRKDFELIHSIGLNTIRLYHTPPSWLMDMAGELGLKVLITIPWEQQLLVLDDHTLNQKIRKTIRTSAKTHSGHPALLGFYIHNEMPPDLVRWYGAPRLTHFLNELSEIIKSEDDGALTSYANFPPTEYLIPQHIDFLSYNVYLHHQENLRSYLAKLQTIADEKPLVLGEFGMDTIRHSQKEQADLLEMHYEEVFRGGLAGTILFSWTDEWFTGGMEITDWAFGLVNPKREPKTSFHRISHKTITPHLSIQDKYPLPSYPKVSIIVCSYNGASTLESCLNSLLKLHYPNTEIILVDDGSTDTTPAIAAHFQTKGITSIQQPNKGLSVARNVGIQASSGEIIAFTDSDCMADPDWLYYLIQSLLHSDAAAVGGPNISPPATQWIQATVAAAPGAPCHVLFNDTEAEHIPGCNMAFYRWALEAIDGFDPIYRKAGDDVDVCWRLLQLGHKITFSPAALVWHHRRFTVNTYINQQKGYGEAEALLRFKHINYFDELGAIRWKGIIYGRHRSSNLLHQSIIYHGTYALGAFQSIYPKTPHSFTHMALSLEWHGIILLLLTLIPFWEMLTILPLIMILISLTTALHLSAKAILEPRFDSLRSRSLLFLLTWLQPLVRGWARYFTWVRNKQTPRTVESSKETHPHSSVSLIFNSHLAFWNESGTDRIPLLEATHDLLQKEGWKYQIAPGWSNWDINIFSNCWCHVRLRTMTETYSAENRLTRVRLTLTPTTFSILLIALLLIPSTLLLTTHLHKFALTSCTLTLLTITYLALRSILVKKRVAELIHAAAFSVKLLPVSPDYQSSSK